MTHLLINGVFLGVTTHLLILAFDPNFLGDPSGQPNRRARSGRRERVFFSCHPEGMLRSVGPLLGGWAPSGCKWLITMVIVFVP